MNTPAAAAAGGADPAPPQPAAAAVEQLGYTLGGEVFSLTTQTDDGDRAIAERVDGELRYLDGLTLRGMTSVPKYLRDAVAAQVLAPED